MSEAIARTFVLGGVQTSLIVPRSNIGGGDGGGGGRRGEAGGAAFVAGIAAPEGAPHSPQKFETSTIWAPQAAHRNARFAVGSRLVTRFRMLADAPSDETAHRNAALLEVVASLQALEVVATAQSHASAVTRRWERLHSRTRLPCLRGRGSAPSRSGRLSSVSEAMRGSVTASRIGRRDIKRTREVFRYHADSRLHCSHVWTTPLAHGERKEPIRNRLASRGRLGHVQGCYL